MNVFRRAALPVAIAGALAALASASCATSGSGYRWSATPCGGELAAVGAECGRVAVPENYADPHGRSIALNVVLFRASNAGSGRPPLFELEGGPGVSVTANAAFYAQEGAVYHRDRDVVLIDMRGAGGSNPLRCASLEAYQRDHPSAPLYPPDLVAACAAELGARADLTQYTTANAVRDLEAVRQALGAERIALEGLSYGTTLALAYLAEHPTRVSAAVLTSAAPADRTPPRFHAVAAEAALKQIFDACASDAACAARFDPAADFARVLEGATTREEGEMFAERVRAMMYAPSSARRLPLFLHQAVRGEAHAAQGAQPSVADGLYLSITCAESFPHFDVDAARAQARGTPFGDYRLRRQQAACAHWPVTPNTPPRPRRVTTVPVLFVSGGFDPVSPSDWPEAVLPFFPNGRQIVIAGGGHVVDGLSGLDTCYDPLIVRFLDTRDAAGLDTSCLADVRPPPFALE